jgi:hypothetical protein
VDLSTFEKQGEGRSDPLEKCAPSADREITPRLNLNYILTRPQISRTNHHFGKIKTPWA